jgi:phosphatidylserine decarboxylase
MLQNVQRILLPQTKTGSAPDRAKIRTLRYFPPTRGISGFQNISKIEGIFIKGAVFDLATLLQDENLAKRYHEGAIVLVATLPGRLSSLSFSGRRDRWEHPDKSTGRSISVNPIALKQNIRIFSSNKRAITEIDSPEFGKVLMLEIGATCVGSFEYTYKPGIS